MSEELPGDVTLQLRAWNAGDRDAFDRLVPLVQSELYSLAKRNLASERSHLTLRAMELVNEAYLRLLDQKAVSWKNRNHFYGIAAQLMRRIIVDDARRRLATKRGGGAVQVTFNDQLDRQQKRDFRLIALNEALERLQQRDPRQSRVVDLRYFAGLDVEKTAQVLGVSVATIKREWSSARAWLYRELRGSKG